MDALVTVEGLWKRYAKNLKASLRYAARDLWRATLSGGGPEVTETGLRQSEFWALRDIGFSLRRGDVLAIMGHNGAGKSTLLKCIAGKLKPDKGAIAVTGQMGHLLEMSAGFMPTLTGRENVRIRGRLMGISGAALDRYVDAVAAFAEIDDFFDAPVQFYSSGMRSRLGFAASSMTQPDVLIIDEVLAVGDLSFRLRCYERISEMAKNAAVLFVSHSLGQVTRICNRAVYLEKGRLLHYGDVQQAVALYQEKLSHSATRQRLPVLNPELIGLALHAGGAPAGETAIDYGTPLTLRMDVSRLPPRATFRVLLKDASSDLLMDWNSVRADIDWSRHTGTLAVDLGPAELNPGTYSLSVLVLDSDGNNVLCLSEAIFFRVAGALVFESPIQKKTAWTFIE